jgi:hypothetical protein
MCLQYHLPSTSITHLACPQVLVLDEADLLLSYGYEADLELLAPHVSGRVRMYTACQGGGGYRLVAGESYTESCQVVYQAAPVPGPCIIQNMPGRGCLCRQAGSQWQVHHWLAGPVFQQARSGEYVPCCGNPSIDLAATEILAPLLYDLQVPRSCQCLLMSATVSEGVERLTRLVLHNPVTLNLLQVKIHRSKQVYVSGWREQRRVP